MRTWKLPATALVVGALGLAGCGSSSPAATKRATVPSTIPSQVANNTDLRQDVSIGSCASAPGGWGAVGTARNPGTSPATYTITVFFTSAQATVEGYAVAKTTVGPGKTSEWKATATIANPDPGTLCVLRGVA